MKDLYKDYLFTKHILVSDVPSHRETFRDPFPVLVTLGQKFGVRIHKHPELAEESMIHDCERNLGAYVPEPFYCGFPQTVRELTQDQLLFDQLLHYTQTYGCGWFDEAGHSVMEQAQPRKEAFDRVAYNERIPPKDFDILTAEEAMDTLKGYMTDLLSSNRPLNESQLELIREGWKDFSMDIFPKYMACKDTVIFMLCELRDLNFCRFLKLSDVIKLLRYIQWTRYQSENLKKLNLKNQDRKLITNVINELIRLDMAPNGNYCDYVECFEKRKIWCGLLHHIHYQVPMNCGLMSRFVTDVRSNKNFSVYSYFERNMKRGDYRAAANVLAQRKSKSELIRHLNYILSRCKTDAEIEGVFKCLE